MITADNVLELIGNTPFVWLKRVVEGEVKVGAKCEFLNPSGSLKDRMALQIIEDAEASGRLRPGMRIIDASTGNTGIALTLVGVKKGYRVAIYMPEEVSEERKRIIERLGGEVVLFKGAPGVEGEESIAGAEIEVPGRRRCLEEERADPNTFWARQFSNPSNTKAHLKTGRELLEQAGGRVDCFVASVGTGGTLFGVAKVLKEANPRVRIVAVEPAASKYPLLKSFMEHPEAVSEVSGGILKDIADAGIVDEVVRLGDQEAVSMARRLIVEEGLCCGVSSGANVLVALREASKLPKGSIVATVLPDHMDRYLSSEHYTT